MDSTHPHPPRPAPGPDAAGPAAGLSPEDRDLIAEYILLRALTRLELRGQAPAAPAPRRRRPRRSLRRHP